MLLRHSFNYFVLYCASLCSSVVGQLSVPPDVPLEATEGSSTDHYRGATDTPGFGATSIRSILTPKQL